MASNGLQSFTVFTYQCGELNWVQGSSAGIGFSASSTLFANHPLSQQANVNNIACLNQTCPPWNDVVYQLNSINGKWDIEWNCLQSVSDRMYGILENNVLIAACINKRTYRNNDFQYYFD